MTKRELVGVTAIAAGTTMGLLWLLSRKNATRPNPVSSALFTRHVEPEDMDLESEDWWKTGQQPYGEAW